MEDEVLLQQAINCSTAYFDGFGAFRNINGVLRCIGYIHGSGAQLNLVVSLTGADHAFRETQRVLDEGPTKQVLFWRGMNLAH